MSDELLIKLDQEISRSWLSDLRTESLIRQARHVADASQGIRIVDGSGTVGQLLDVIVALADRLESKGSQS